MSQVLNQLKTLERRMHSPKTDLVETSTSYIIRMELAVRDFEWNIKDQQYLFVTYTKDPDYGIENDTVKIIYSETKYGKNIRRVKLPTKISGEVLSETWDYGVWVIHFHKHNVSDAATTKEIAYVRADNNQEHQTFLKNEPFQPIVMGSWADE